MKRGLSGLSLVVGVDKPLGLSSHDVVNRVRRIFGEKRVGHTGTLDPLASGALLVCVGPATRLNPYLTMDNKRYRFRVAFGAATETDDSAGEIIRTGPVPDEVFDPFFAGSFVAGLVGAHRQMPPVYSAIKVDGERSYKAARAGNIIELQPRDIEIYEAALVGVAADDNADYPSWDIVVHVSKGTYIRSLARDIGNALGVPAHVTMLRRETLGLLHTEECYDLEELEVVGESAAIDPVSLLGFRILFAPDEIRKSLANGNAIDPSGQRLFTSPRCRSGVQGCGCTTSISESEEMLEQDEMISVVGENRLMGLYRFDRETLLLKPQCVFSVGVSRGKDS